MVDLTPATPADPGPCTVEFSHHESRRGAVLLKLNESLASWHSASISLDGLECLAGLVVGR